MRKIELLAPAGDYECLETAIHFGCDAVYFAGKKFGLRTFSPNFDLEGIKKAVEYCHDHRVKAYITLNILAHNVDFLDLVDYIKYLDSVDVDGVIVSDMGIASLVTKHTNLELHVSTQANITNKYSALAWVKLGAKRLVLARELSLKEIREIKDTVGEDIDIECFVHGAMCISYSGRCLLSNYFTGRDSNKGACAQPCRWGYAVSKIEETEEGKISYLPIAEDERGTYVFNSKDMCLIEHISELIEAGITSFKIEGRMKTPYYVGTVVNGYRRAIDDVINNKEKEFDYLTELAKTSNRSFTTGFYFNASNKTNTLSSAYIRTHDFIATVVSDSDGEKVGVELRNKFVVGDQLEILSAKGDFLKNIFVDQIMNEKGELLFEAKKVKEVLYLKTHLKLYKNDILRRKINE